LFCVQAESLGNDGKVEDAQLKTAKCDLLRIERLKLQEVTVLQIKITNECWTFKIVYTLYIKPFPLKSACC